MVRVTCPEGKMQSNEPPKVPKTVRVLKPPGGGSSISFGDGNDDYDLYRKGGIAAKPASTNGFHKDAPKPVAEEPPKTPVDEAAPAAAAAATEEAVKDSPTKENEASATLASPPAETAESSPEKEKVVEPKQNGAGKDEKIQACMTVDSTVVSESCVSSNEVTREVSEETSTEVCESSSKEACETTSAEVCEVVCDNFPKISLSDSALATDVSPNDPKVASPSPDVPASLSFPVPSEFTKKSDSSLSTTQTPSTPAAHPVPCTPTTPDARPIVECPLPAKTVQAPPTPEPQPQPKRIPDHMRSSIFNPSSHDYQNACRGREPPKRAPAPVEPAPAPAVQPPQRQRIPPGGFSSKLW